MKKTLLFASLLIGGLFQTQAQCTISPSCSTGTIGYCTTPLENTSLPAATVGTPYSTVIQVSIGSSVGGVATITSGTLVSVTGLPAGMGYSINPTSGILPANSNACVLIAGTPSAGSAGNYTVVASVGITTSFGTFPPATVSWFLTVNPSGTTGLLNYEVTRSLFISPNPASTDLFLSSENNIGKVNIIDALGKIVLTHDASNMQESSINIQNLNKGVYFVQINDGSKMITKKFIKD